MLSEETLDGIERELKWKRYNTNWRERNAVYWAERAYHRRAVQELPYEKIVEEILEHPGYDREQLMAKTEDDKYFGRDHVRDTLAALRHTRAIRARRVQCTNCAKIVP